MKRNIFTGLLVLAGTLAFGQNAGDALRYSYLSPIGTARYSAVGGAFGALGGDFTTLGVNPGGIGIYRKSEFTISPSITGSGTDATYGGITSSDSKMNFNFSNIGFVANWKSKKDVPRGWFSGSFAVGYTRTNSFHERQLIEGNSMSGTRVDSWVGAANGIDYENIYNTYPFDVGLAWETYLIDTLSGSTNAYGSLVGANGVSQKLEKTIRGSMGETVIAFGGNYSNRIYVGASIGFPNIRYEENSTYTESDAGDSIPNFTSYEYNYNLTTKGNGYNFKVGVIYRAADWLRLGGAIHTPTYFQMTDAWDSDLTNNAYGTILRSASDPGLFDYGLTTPFRAIGSAGFVFGKMGMVSADYEHVDYSQARLRSSLESFSAENNTVKSTYKSVGNVRVGTEWRYQAFSFRAGCQLLGNPYEGGISTDRPIYSGGIGYREKNFFVDFAYIHKTAEGEVYLYDPSISAPASLNYSEGTGIVTLGFRY